MKRCPECRRDYYDETLLYCLEDGSALVQGPMPPPVEPETAILHETNPPSEAATSAQIHTTEQTAVLPSNTSGVARGSFDKRLLLVPAGVVLIVLGGFFAYKYTTQARQVGSIAVMPFVNASGNPEAEYLSDGMTESLISGLSQVPNLSVKGRSIVFRYKGKDVDPQTVGQELNVQAIVNGRVLQKGDTLTVSLELLDTSTDNVIWSDRYERRSSDLVSLQSEIARDVSSKLKAKLSGADAAKVEKTYTTDPEAYQLYLKGRYQWNRRTPESLRQSADYFNQAIQKDPNYALAYSGLAETYSLFSSYSVALSKDCLPQAKAAAERALALDDSIAGAHAALAEYHIYFEYDRAAGEVELRKAIELDPNYPTAHQWIGTDVLAVTKRFDEALSELRRAEELDPLSPIIATNTGDTLQQMRRYDDAIAQYKRTLTLDANFGYAHSALGMTYGNKGMYAEAIAETRRFIELSADPSGKGYLSLWLGKAGHRDEAMKLLAELKQDSSHRYVQNYAFAMCYLGLGQKEEALNALEKEISDRSPNAIFFGVYPELDELRSEPRFKDMLKRLNLPE